MLVDRLWPGEKLSDQLIGLWLVAAPAPIVLAVGAYRVFVRPARIKALYTHGVAVGGRVVGRKRTGRHGECLEIRYEFVRPDGVLAKRNMTVPVNDYVISAWTGEPVTVLHPGNRRARPSVIYECGEYECEGAEWI
jgi:hypothetical protein